MPDLKILKLPELVAVPASGNLWLVVVHNGETKRIKASVLLAG